MGERVIDFTVSGAKMVVYLMTGKTIAFTFNFFNGDLSSYMPQVQGVISVFASCTVACFWILNIIYKIKDRKNEEIRQENIRLENENIKREIEYRERQIKYNQIIKGIKNEGSNNNRSL